MIIIAILVGLCAGAAIFFLLDHFSIKKLPIQQFKREQEKVIQGLVEKKNAVEKEFNEDIERRHKERKQQLEAKYAKEAELLAARQQMEIESYSKATEDAKYKHSHAISQLEHDYKEKAEHYKREEEIANLVRRQNMEKEIQDEQRRLSTSLEKLNADYKEKKEAIDESFFNYSAAVNQKRAALEQEIQTYENKQKEIINRFKADEERRQKANFYKIELSDIERQDIAKLKKLALEFSRPEVIFKIIYEVYYKARLEEMFKRVLGDNKDKGGIYKITNLTNEKAYIGRTTSYLSRWRLHSKRGCNIERISGQLYDAMWNDGLENFTWEIVEICPREEQSEKEKYYIKFYNTNSYGYNSNKGG